MDRSASRRTRRDVVRLLALSAATLPAMLRPGAVSASVRWCRVDPGLQIGDRQTHLTVSSHQAMLQAANGPIGVIVHIPSGFKGKVQLLHPDDNGFGFNYILQEVRQSAELVGKSGGINIEVEAYAPASDSTLPVKVEVGPNDPNAATAARRGSGRHAGATGATRSALGKANEWISVDQITI